MTATSRSRVPPSTSASQLTCYAMCPRKYALRYCTDTPPEFVSTNLVLGSAVHSAIGWWFEEKLAGRTPTIENAERILAIDFLAITTDVTVRWKKDTTPADVETDGKRLVRLYLTRYGDEPVTAVEEPFEVELVDPRTGEVLGRPLRGYFDLRLHEKTVELKTSSRGWNPFDLVRHLQVGAYSFARHAITGRSETIEARVLVKLKREPRIEVHPVERDVATLGWWLSAAAAIERAIEAGIFPPTPGPLCHECEYEKACAGWTEVQIAVPSGEPRLPVRRERPVMSATELSL